MARQKGIIKIQGELGDISFYKTIDGFLAREKSSVDSERVKTDPAFQRTRENGQEFGRAGKGTKLLRSALREILLLASDGRMTSRLIKQMMRVIKTDATSPRGQRNVIGGEVELLQGFEFNGSAQLTTTFHAPFTAAIDRVGGSLSVSIPPFAPGNMVTAPAGATHFRLIMGGTEVNFEKNFHLSNIATSERLPIDHADTASLTLETLVTPNTALPLFLAFGIEFYQHVNGQYYTLNNGAFNALSLVQVNGGV